jgi:hypothetical protein
MMSPRKPIYTRNRVIAYPTVQDAVIAAHNEYEWRIAHYGLAGDIDLRMLRDDVRAIVASIAARAEPDENDVAEEAA